MLTEGQKPYTPTQAQWLAVVLNSTNLHGGSPVFQHGYSVYYLPDSEKDTITIFLQHPKDVSQETVDRLISLLKDSALEAAKTYCWDSWINIEMNVEVGE